MADETPKGEGRGRGAWTERGVQAAQDRNIEELIAFARDAGPRLDQLEAAVAAGTTPTPEPTPTDGDGEGLVNA